MAGLCLAGSGLLGAQGTPAKNPLEGNADAIRGGMGTVTGLSLVWNKIQTRVIGPRPLVLLGDCWPPVVEQWQKYLAVSDADVSALDFATTADEAVEIIKLKSQGVVL